MFSLTLPLPRTRAGFPHPLLLQAPPILDEPVEIDEHALPELPQLPPTFLRPVDRSDSPLHPVLRGDGGEQLQIEVDVVRFRLVGEDVNQGRCGVKDGFRVAYVRR